MNARYLAHGRDNGLEKSKIMARPQGRPLAEHLWRDGGWYHAVTEKPFDQEVYIAGVRRRQAECERRRYWDDTSGTRTRRLLRSMRDAAKRPRKRRGAMQLTLESAPCLAAELRHILKVSSHRQQTQNACEASGGDTTMTYSGGEGLAALHGHTQYSIA